MDTLFRLVSLQSSSEEQKHQQYFEEAEQECSFIINYNNHQQQQQQQFHQVLPYYFTMDNPDEHFSTASASSSSSSKAHYLPPHSELHLPNTSSIINNPTPHQYHTLDHEDSSLLFFSDPSRRWASDLLLDCARAVAFRDSPRVQHLMWILNELASPYGDLVDHKLASYFLQALFARLTSSGPRTLRTLSNASDRSSSFDSTRRTALRFQELSPWSSFGHVAANAAILESFFLLPRSTTSSSSSSSHDRPTRLHILDLSTTFCTQWPTLLEALATRSSADETPHVSITAVVPSASPAARRVMREIAARMEKFGRLMAVPFRFSVVHHPNSDLSSLDLDSIVTSLDSSSSSSSTSTLLAVNCVNSLHGVPPSDLRRETLLAKIRRLRPGIITVVEEEADLDSPTDNGDEEEGFLKVFREGLRFFSAYFDSLEECFPKTSNERLALERAAGRAMVDLVACPAGESSERRETAAGWSRRMRNAGFLNLGFSEDVNDDMRALLKRYKEGWGMRAAAPAPEVVAEEEFAGAGAGIFLTWKEEAVVWASVWKLA